MKHVDRAFYLHEERAGTRDHWQNYRATPGVVEIAGFGEALAGHRNGRLKLAAIDIAEPIRRHLQAKIDRLADEIRALGVEPDPIELEPMEDGWQAKWSGDSARASMRGE